MTVTCPNCSRPCEVKTNRRGARYYRCECKSFGNLPSAKKPANDNPPAAERNPESANGPGTKPDTGSSVWDL